VAFPLRARRSGGFRKLHWADRRRGKEKRGGLRVIYYDLVADTQIWFVTVYDKDEASDLSADEKRALEGGHRVGIATACRAAKTAAEVSDGQEEKERRSHATISAHAGRSPCGDRRDAPASRLARRVAGLTGRSLINTARLGRSNLTFAPLGRPERFSKSRVNRVDDALDAAVAAHAGASVHHARPDMLENRLSCC
jgi:hypothetical protein